MCAMCWLQLRGHAEACLPAAVLGGEKRTAGFSPPGEEPPLIGISWISKSCSTSGCESASTSGARSVALRKRYFQKRAFQSAAPSLLP